MTVMNTMMKDRMREAMEEVAGQGADGVEKLEAPTPPDGVTSTQGAQTDPAVLQYIEQRNDWIKVQAQLGEDPEDIRAAILASGMELSLSRVMQVIGGDADGPVGRQAEVGSRGKGVPRLRTKRGERIVVQAYQMRALRKESKAKADAYARAQIEMIIQMRADVEREHMDLEAETRKALLGGL